VVVGLLEISAPLDDVMRVMRNHARAHDASGQIVVITIDSPTVAAHGEWPWPRNKVADLVERIDAAGAKQLAFEHVFVPTGSAEMDTSLAKAFAKLPAKPLIGANFDKDPVTHGRRFQKPALIFNSVASTVGIPLYFNGFGHAWRASYSMKAEGEAFPSLAAAMAGVQEMRDRSDIIIDYSINPRSIPQISALQVMDGSAGSALVGKTVLISTGRFAENVPGGEPVPTALIHVIAAETMRLGDQTNLDWAPGFAFAALCSLALWFGRRRVAASVGVIAGGALLFGPILLEVRDIYLNPAAGLLLCTCVLVIRAWRSYRRGDARVNPLTGLPNLLALKERKGTPADAVVAVRVKNYSELVAALAQNEDVLATQIASRLKTGNASMLYQGDDGIFCWVANGVAHDELSDQLEAIHSFFLLPVAVGNWQVDVSIAFGIESGTSDDLGARFASALVAADEAAAAGHRWKYYDPARLNEAEWNMSLLGRLDTAIETGEVWVAYQPQMDLRTGLVTGAEALVRWTHPDRGSVSPEEFVSVAEAHGRIDKLTYFVLDQALATVAATHVRLGVAVNLSAQMFSRKDFVHKVQEALRRYRVKAAMLTIEITESAAVENEADMYATVNALTALGVTVSIDDYGTGYCTLEYLKTIKATELKIDRGFVAAMDHNRSDRVLVNATIELAHSLGHSVVAEGVETLETLDLLKSMGCDKAQGFFISRPMPREEFFHFVDRQERPEAA
jgi:EAL domain-containing protein (putative c-di-GMP-specific phosphodiesterase class I)